MQIVITTRLLGRNPHGLRAGLTREPGHVQVLGTLGTDNGSSHGGGKA